MITQLPGIHVLMTLSLCACVVGGLCAIVGLIAALAGRELRPLLHVARWAVALAYALFIAWILSLAASR